uniref:Uncharacterized protein n=1 Tax=Anguilla anguilla TaxID=7936 RepID=A0A0E9RZT4_ANGAN
MAVYSTPQYGVCNMQYLFFFCISLKSMWACEYYLEFL